VSPSEILSLIDLYVITDVPKRPSAFNLRVMQSVSSASDKSLSSRGCGRCGRAAGTSFVHGIPGFQLLAHVSYAGYPGSNPVPKNIYRTVVFVPSRSSSTQRSAQYVVYLKTMPDCLPQNFLFIIRSSRQQSMLYNKSYWIKFKKP
jgi:hypothetical protein